MFVTVGRYLESVAKGKTSEGILKAKKHVTNKKIFFLFYFIALTKLMSLQPAEALLLEMGANDRVVRETMIPVELLQRNDIVQVGPGDKIPTDGTLMYGSSYVDESMVTGEHLAVAKLVGSHVICGSVNQNGLFRMRVTRVGTDTTLAQITRLIDEAQVSKGNPFYYFSTIIVYFLFI